MSRELRTCIVYRTPKRTISETFLHAQERRLPGQVWSIIWSPDACSIKDEGWTSRMQHRFRRRVFRQSAVQLREDLLTRYLLRTRPDVVLAQYGCTGTFVMNACSRAKVPLVVHFHGYDASRTDILELRATAYRQLFAQASAVVAVSKGMRDVLVGIGAPADKVYVNVYGVDVAQFQLADPGCSDPVLLAVGNFVEKKAPHLTVLAFAQALEACPHARLRMVGGGPLLGACKDLAAHLGIARQIHFLGAQPHEVVPFEMQRARAFVQHSVRADNGDSEGTPNSVLEACASGLPVISTRHAGIPEVVEEGVTGLLVDERDVAGMAVHMRAVLERPDYARDLGREGRLRIERFYRIEDSIARLAAILEGAAGKMVVGARQSCLS